MAVTTKISEREVSYAPESHLSNVEGSSINKSLLKSYQQIAAGLSQGAGKEARVMNFSLVPGGKIPAEDLIVGVAIGPADTTRGGGSPGDPVLRLYVSEEIPPENVAELAATAFGAENLNQTGFEVIHTGPIDALAHRMHMRPAPCGISCGHYNISAGTLGALARGRQTPRDQMTLILSNNHVLADVNAGQQNDDILQPGPYDGGTPASHAIAGLERFVRIDFSNPNYVDCATAELRDASSASGEHLFLQNGQPAFFRCGTMPVAASVGMSVGKSGRTTQLTAGRVTGVKATIRVNMGAGRVAVFQDQIEIRGLTGHFSQPGDSGSLIWTWDEHRQPVALLFAGGGALTFANPIHHVLNALDINLL